MTTPDLPRPLDWSAACPRADGGTAAPNARCHTSATGPGHDALIRPHEKAAWTDANDAALAELLRYRDQTQKAQVWVTLGIFVGTFGSMVVAAAVLPAHTVMAVLTAMVTALAMGTGLAIERVTRHAFLRRAHALGLSDKAGEDLYLRSRGVGGYIAALSAFGESAQDKDIVSYLGERPDVVR